MSLSAEVRPRTAPGSMLAIRTGRFLTALVVLFLMFDGIAKVMKLGPVREACALLEVPERVIPGLGVILIAGALIYAIPWTALPGAVVLTGYLGGATWTHVRIGDPVFSIVFPSLVAALIWGGLLLREPRLRALFPVRRSAPLRELRAMHDGTDSVPTISESQGEFS